MLAWILVPVAERVVKLVPVCGACHFVIGEQRTAQRVEDLTAVGAADQHCHRVVAIPELVVPHEVGECPALRVYPLHFY